MFSVYTTSFNNPRDLAWMIHVSISDITSLSMSYVKTILNAIHYLVIKHCFLATYWDFVGDQ